MNSLLDLFRTTPKTVVIGDMMHPTPAVTVDHATKGTIVVPVATRRMGRFAAGTAATAMAFSVIGSNEGIVQVAYPDPVSKGNPWTICLGHTGPDVTPGLRLAMAQCRVLFAQDVAKEWAGVEKCIGTDVTDKWSDSRAVGVLDLAHNVGAGAICRSSLPALFKAGRDQDACDGMMAFNKALGMVRKFLIERRARDRKLCLETI